MTLRGKNSEFPIHVVVRLLADTKKTGELTLHGTTGEGALGFDAGRVVTAVYGDESPIASLSALYSLEGAEFEFTPWDEPPQANLEGDLDELLRRAEEHRTWLSGVREVIPSDRHRFRLSEQAADGGAVTFTSDRWRAVLAVDGQRDVNALAQHLGRDRDGTLDLLAGLVREKVIEAIEPPADEPPPPPPSPEPPPVEMSASAPSAEDWTAALVREHEPQTEEAHEAFAMPAAPEPEPEPEPEPPAPAVDAWGPPVPAEPEPAEPVDDRLAALFGAPAEPAPAEPAPPPAPDAWAPAQWSPQQEQTWAPPAPETPAPPADDPRLAAMSAAAAPEAPIAEPPPPIAPTPSEWAPPPAEAPAPAKRGGLFGGLFRREEPTNGTSAAVETGASRSGKLAAFSNALLAEYNSGQYGKARIDDHLPSLLMRVDEQADPIDRPLPVVDDRLDVQALDRVNVPEQQAVPYLATLVSTIYGDAEKAFGRDKAKRGYRAAQQQVFGADLSAISAPDVAGKLPKI